MIHSLPVLPYAYSALEPYIDRRTMQVHHERHHAWYVNNLNLALEKHPELQSQSLEDLLRHIGRVPQNIRAAVRNNGGGHANHSLFWQVIGPKSSDDPTGTIGEAIRSSFGDFERFKDQFSKAAMSVFGSGWAWLVDRGDTLVIETTANQDSPLMEGRTPLCGLDLWEHAYYLQYQNRRAEYVHAWWNIINWAEVNRRLTREAVAVAAK